MKICRAQAPNLKTIIRAAKAGDLALVEGRVKATGEVVAVLCAIGRNGTQYAITPFGHLCGGNPFEFYDPPNPNGGFTSELDHGSEGTSEGRTN